MSDIKQKVIDVVAEQLGLDSTEVSEDKRFVEDLNADSLDLMELMMSFEELFKCEIPEGDAEKLRTVGEVCDYIEKKQADLDKNHRDDK